MGFTAAERLSEGFALGDPSVSFGDLGEVIGSRAPQL